MLPINFSSPFVDAILSPGTNFAGVCFKLVLSMVLGSVVGFERGRRGQTAGVRTFSLISMGSALAMVLSVYVAEKYGDGDPTRMAAQVISGVGFLGAGAIIQMKGSVRGLTTAAGIWMSATIGMAVGVGLYLISIVATLLVLAILTQFDRFEHRIHMGMESRTIRLRIQGIVSDIKAYRTELESHKVSLTNVYVEYDYDENVTRLNLVVLISETADYIDLFATLSKVNPTLSIALANQTNI